MPDRTSARRPLIVALIALLLAGLAVVFIATRQFWRPLVSVEAFKKAYAADDRESVMSMYRLALNEKNSAPLDSERRTQAAGVVEVIEDTVSADAAARFQAVLNGAALSDADSAFFASYDALSTTVLLDAFTGYAHAYLRGEHSNEAMRHMLEQSLRIDVVNQTYGRVKNEYAAMVEARPKILDAEQLMNEGNWYDATKSWQRLESDRSMSHFTKGYIEQRAQDAKERLLEETIKNVSHLLEQRKYYTARELLNVILPIFPFDQDLLNFNREAEEQLPKSFISWNLPVDHIAVRPLIAFPERAFSNTRYMEAADRWLLLASEFQTMLKSLYDNNYVLVSDDAFLTEAGVFKTFKIPEGKKPLVLVFDSFHFAPTRVLSGTPEKLIVTETGEIAASWTADDGTDRIIRNGDAVSLLEAFLREYPDFSFNGAKAVVAVTGQYGLFGHVLNPAQAILVNEQRTVNGMPPRRYDETIIESERADAEAVVSRLLERGYTFASNTYADLSLPDAAAEQIREDDTLFKSVIGPFIGDIRTFSYPGGRHVNSVPEKTALLTELGYSRLLAHGTIAYFAYGDGYAHIDMNLIGGYALRNPFETGINRYFDTQAILDRTHRPF